MCNDGRTLVNTPYSIHVQPPASPGLFWSVLIKINNLSLIVSRSTQRRSLYAIASLIHMSSFNRRRSYHEVNHTSVVGMRATALSRGHAVMCARDIGASSVASSTTPSTRYSRGLYAYPAQVSSGPIQAYAFITIIFKSHVACRAIFLAPNFRLSGLHSCTVDNNSSRPSPLMIGRLTLND